MSAIDVTPLDLVAVAQQLCDIRERLLVLGVPVAAELAHNAAAVAFSAVRP